MRKLGLERRTATGERFVNACDNLIDRIGRIQVDRIPTNSIYRDEIEPGVNDA